MLILEKDLHPYQLETRDAVVSAVQEDITRPLIVVPTGMGKTVIFSHVAKAIGARRTLIIAHREELLTQARAKLLMCWPGVDVGIVQGALNQVDRRIVVASIQTLDRPNRRAQLDDVGLIIIDEAHHAAARSYQAVLQHFGAFDLGGPPVLGVTATPNRSDGLGLSGVFQKVVKEIEILWGIENGYLSDLVGVQCRLKMDLDKIRSQAGDFSEGELAKAMMEASAPTYIYRSYMQHAADRRAVVFTPTVEVARATAAEFERNGVPAAWISGETPDREAVLERFQRGEYRVMANCAVLTEGYDDPTLDCVIVARPTRSQGMYMQMVGRGTRRAPGKQNCMVIDLMGNTKRHSLQCMASLFGVADGEGVLAGQERKKREAEQPPAPPKPKPNVTIDPNTIEVHSRVADLFDRSGIIWNKVARRDGFDWAVYLGSEGSVSIQEVDGEHTIIHIKGGLPDLVASYPIATDIDIVRRRAEAYIRSLGSLTAARANKEGRWRGEPVSDAQRKMLRYLRIPHKEGMTKGEANDLINKAKAGGGAR